MSGKNGEVVISQSTLLLSTAVLFALAAVVLAVVAGILLIGGNDNDARARILEISGEAKSFPDDSEERDKALRGATRELLEIAEKVKDPYVKSVAYLNAGILALGEFERAVAEFEAQEKQYSFNKPSGTELYSAIAHFQEAVRICSSSDESEDCYLEDAKRRLDYALGLFEKHFQRRPGVSKSEKSNGENEKLKEELGKNKDGEELKKRARDSITEGKESDSSQARQKVPGDADKELRRDTSVRGRLSEELEYDQKQDDILNPGGGFQAPPNRP